VRARHCASAKRLLGGSKVARHINYKKKKKYIYLSIWFSITYGSSAMSRGRDNGRWVGNERQMTTIGGQMVNV